MRLDEICEKAPRAGINGLVYLKDVDTAKELLIGKTVYIQSESARVDDANNYSGYQNIAIPVNTEATITAIGVGSQAYPVKIVALSRRAAVRCPVPRPERQDHFPCVSERPGYAAQGIFC